MLLFSLFATIARFGCVCDAFSIEQPPSGEGVGRREVVRATFHLGLSGGLLSILGPSNAVAAADATTETGVVAAADATTETGQKASSGFFSYRIVPDASPGPDLNPGLKPISSSELKKTLAMTRGNGGALWLGEHHNSLTDHQLQADFVQDIYDQRKRSFGRKAPPHGHWSGASAVAIPASTRCLRRRKDIGRRPEGCGGMGEEVELVL